MKSRESGVKQGVTGRAIALAGLLDYQKDAIVSRTLIDCKTGTVTLFAFDKGQGLSEHTAPFDALVYIADGEAAVYVAGRKNAVKAGELIVMPAGKPHALTAEKKFKMLLVMVRS